MLETYQSQFLKEILEKNSGTKKQLPVAPFERLSVYRNNYFGGALKHLTQLFAITVDQMEEDRFAQLAYQYIRALPPQSENLNLYGAGFPDFIEKHLSDSVWLADVARADYFKQCCYYAPNNIHFDLGEFLALPPEHQLTARFVIQPTLFVLRTKGWLLGLLKGEQKGEKHDRDDETVFVLFYRHLGKVKFISIPEPLAKALERFSIPNSLEQLEEEEMMLFPQLVQNGWLILL